MKKWKEYPIYKKRDGQSYKFIGYIYADSWSMAKKKFAVNMTDDNHNASNDIVWLTKNDGVRIPGFYDMSRSMIIYKDDETIDYKKSHLELFCSESAINKGFDSWNEDVYTWELRKP